MEIRHYRMQIERILSNQSIKVEYLCCFLCKNILWQPEKCGVCHTHYCKYCIMFSLLKSKKCPTCLNDYSSLPPDSYLLADINELQVKCCYHSNGCKNIMKYSELLEHENECIFQEGNCEECGNKILQKNYYTHIVLCKNSFCEGTVIDFAQIVSYFKEKLDKMKNESMNEIEKIKQFFFEISTQKEAHLEKLLRLLVRQKKLLEDIYTENEKNKCKCSQGVGQNYYEEFVKICSKKNLFENSQVPGFQNLNSNFKLS